ncbi:hypothetical protein L9F63_005894 [Diploptera punctata]|uniref:Uncharacterized protein n=1 Tax=Diploptera punctata TaxID=6984 RepID=A0AAD7ZBL6_DIPPU|nr:hypothetical protein L9F63_005894 [Diploptera punctata]
MKTLVVLLVSLAVCSTYNTRSRKDDKYDQVMLSPRILPEEMYGPDYVWDNKGMPRRIEIKPPVRRYYNSAPIRRPQQTSLRVHFLPRGLDNAMNMLNSRRSQNYRIRFPDSSRNRTRKPEPDDDIEQRMMLPSGKKIPDKMYGPDYDWNTKGWPEVIKQNPETVRYPVRNRGPQRSSVYFPENGYRR